MAANQLWINLHNMGYKKINQKFKNIKLAEILQKEFKVPVKIEVVEPGRELNFGEIKLVALPAYNIDKHFHPKDEGWLGYLIKMNNDSLFSLLQEFV